MESSQPIILKVSNVDLQIEGHFDKDIRDELKHVLSYVVPGYKFMARYKQSQFSPNPWDGTITLAVNNRRNEDILVAPTGLYSYVLEVLKKYELPYKTMDMRPDYVKSAGYSHTIMCRDYQRSSIDEGLKRERGILKIATGGGKTETVIATMVEASVFPAIFYVTSCDLLEQAYDRFRKYVLKNGVTAEIGRIGGGHCDIQDITIATVQSCQQALTGKYTNFDDCDPNDTTKFSDIQKGEIRNLVKESQFAYVDECFYHRTQVLLPDGKTASISKLVNERYKGQVVSWNPKTLSFENKQVIGWVRKKPIHNVVRIRLGNIGGVICTDHHVFFTSRGNLEARELTRGDAVFCPSTNAGGVQAISEEAKQVLYGSIGDGHLSKPAARSINSRLVITHGLAQQKYLKYKLSFFAPLPYEIRPIKSGYTGLPEGQGVTACSPDISLVHAMSEKDRVKKMNLLGLSILFLDDGSYNRRQGTGTIACMDHDEEVRNALIEQFGKYKIKASQFETNKGWVLYIPRIGMEVFGKDLARYAPPCMRYKVPPQFLHIKLHAPEAVPNYCWRTVRSVTPYSLPKKGCSSDVYCLKVSDNHNFVANGCVVHNCQHVAAQTIQDILNSSYRARFRIGGSASPWRDDGLDILIEAAFGRKYTDISASFLIHNKYLLRPYITFNHFENHLGPAKTFAAHYKKYVCENDARNQWIAERAKYHVGLDRPTIILVKWVSHAERLRDLIPGAEILTASGDSKKSPKKRKEVLDRMRSKQLMCLIGTSLLDEGVDVPVATAGIFAGGGKSSTRELQRVGRFIRPDPLDPLKTCAYIEEFLDNTKWLMHHSKLRRKILATEPQFEITDNKETLRL